MATTPAPRQNIAPPEPNLTPAEMLRRAEALRPILRERQARCEELGRLPEETNQDFLGAGFYRMLQPRCFGGYEFSVADFIRVMMEVSRGCPESGWVLSLTSGHPAAFLAAFPEAGQRHVYGQTGDARVPGVAVPGGVAIPVPGGYRVKGAWDYASGCDIATHLLGAMMAIDPETQKPRAYVYALFDRADFTIVDNWNVIGMQGTGSRRVVAEEMILPEHRVLEFADAQINVYPDHPGRRLHANPLYHGPYMPLLYCELTSVAVGAARGALDIYEQLVRDRKWNLPPFQPRYEMADSQMRFGHVQGLIDTAEAALLRLGDQYAEICRRAHAGVRQSPEEERRFLRVAQQCVQLTWEAVELMFRTGGTSSTKKDAPLGRYFKNLAVIRTHITVQMDHTSMNIGRLHYGLDALSPV
jgi:3-hydroxy-9,10-secoandrosta-1,3,5(10)-triene-9,17-dione monooxygenase